MTKPRKSFKVLLVIQFALFAALLIAVIAIALSQNRNSPPSNKPVASQESPVLLTSPTPEATPTPTPASSEESAESLTNKNASKGNDGVYNMYKGQTGFVVATASPDGYSFTLVEMCNTGWVRFSVVTDAGSSFGSGGGSCEIGKYGLAGHSNSGIIETAKSWFCGGSMTGNSFRAVSESGSTSQWFPVFAEWKDCPQQYLPNPEPVQ